MSIYRTFLSIKISHTQFKWILRRNFRSVSATTIPKIGSQDFRENVFSLTIVRMSTVATGEMKNECNLDHPEAEAR